MLAKLGGYCFLFKPGAQGKKASQKRAGGHRDRYVRQATSTSGWRSCSPGGPWKYGFKSAKSIIKIELVAERPKTFWNTIAPREYGFFSNVNPDVRHPRWSQSTERRIGELERRPTLLFNGYDQEVAYLYEGMDLRASF